MWLPNSAGCSISRLSRREWMSGWLNALQKAILFKSRAAWAKCKFEFLQYMSCLLPTQLSKNILASNNQKHCEFYKTCWHLSIKKIVIFCNLRRLQYKDKSEHSCILSFERVRRKPDIDQTFNFHCNFHFNCTWSHTEFWFWHQFWFSDTSFLFVNGMVFQEAAAVCVSLPPFIPAVPANACRAQICTAHLTVSSDLDEGRGTRVGFLHFVSHTVFIALRLLPPYMSSSHHSDWEASPMLSTLISPWCTEKCHLRIKQWSCHFVYTLSSVEEMGASNLINTD